MTAWPIPWSHRLAAEQRKQWNAILSRNQPRKPPLLRSTWTKWSDTSGWDTICRGECFESRTSNTMLGKDTHLSSSRRNLKQSSMADPKRLSALKIQLAKPTQTFVVAYSGKRTNIRPRHGRSHDQRRRMVIVVYERISKPIWNRWRRSINKTQIKFLSAVAEFIQTDIISEVEHQLFRPCPTGLYRLLKWPRLRMADFAYHSPAIGSSEGFT